VGAPVCCNGRGDALLGGKGEEDGGNGVERAAVWGGCCGEGGEDQWWVEGKMRAGLGRLARLKGKICGNRAALVCFGRDDRRMKCQGVLGSVLKTTTKDPGDSGFFLCSSGGRLVPWLEIKDRFSLGFLVFSHYFAKFSPPLKIQCNMVFIGKVLLGFQTSPSTFPFLLFSFFFCKF